MCAEIIPVHDIMHACVYVYVCVCICTYLETLTWSKHEFVNFVNSLSQSNDLYQSLVTEVVVKLIIFTLIE